MADYKYGRVAVIRALNKILADPGSSTKQKLEAAKLVAQINGWVSDKKEEIKPVSGVGLLGLKRA